MVMLFKVYRQLRLLYAVWMFIEFALFTGVIYGWSSIVFVFKEEGIYASLCPSSNSSKTPVSNTSYTVINAENENEEKTTRPVCVEQDSMLTLAFAISSALTAASSGVTGYIHYKFGTTVVRLIAMLLFFVGVLMIAFLTLETPWLVFPGFTFTGIGGVMMAISGYQIANLFAAARSTVLGLLTGALATSSIVLLVVKLAYEHGIRRRDSMLVICGLHGMVALSTFFFLPRSMIHKFESITELSFEAEDTEGDKYAGHFIAQEEAPNSSVSEKNEVTAGPIKGTDVTDAQNEYRCSLMSEKRTFKSCLFSPEFLLHLFWMCVTQLRCLYFIQTLNPWLTLIFNGDKNKVSYFTNVSLYTTLGSLVTSLLAGAVHDWQVKVFSMKNTEVCRKRMPFVLPLSLTTLLSVCMSVLVFVPFSETLYATFIIFTFLRSFLFAMTISFINVIFPTEYYSMLLGSLHVSVAIISTLQYPLYEWAEFTSYTQVNIFLLLLVLLTFAHPIYQWHLARKSESLIHEQEGRRCGQPDMNLTLNELNDNKRGTDPSKTTSEVWEDCTDPRKNTPERCEVTAL